MATKATIDALQKIAEELRDAGWGDAASRSRLDRASAFRRFAERTMKERVFSLLIALAFCGGMMMALFRESSQPVLHCVMLALAAVAVVVEVLLLGSVMTEWWYRHDPRSR